MAENYGVTIVGGGHILVRPLSFEEEEEDKLMLSRQMKR
jgi:hypothetical protein